MRLIHGDLVNYRRFRNETGIELDPALVCVVGPNEAGKSSLIDAMAQLDNDQAFTPAEKTRGTPGSAIPRVRARFVLEDEDRQALAGIPEATRVRQLVMWKRGGGSRGHRLEPEPERDLRPRRDVRRRLERLRDAGWPAADDENLEDPERIRTLISTVVGLLESDEQTLESDVLDVAAGLQEEIEKRPVPWTSRALPRRLADLIANERAEHPHQRALAALIPRIPGFKKFGDPERQLRAVYTLGEDDDPAIRNLLALAGTSYDDTFDIASDSDRGRKTVWADRTQARLAENFSRAWKQSELEVRLHLEGMVLAILISMQAEDFIEIDQRSDGLRQFVALRSFVIQQAGGGPKPVVLIDEAEAHLHYDAQADLVQVLEEQEETAKIIYTTHSAGCLPRDLGQGIRAVVPVELEVDGQLSQTDDSEVINRFWTHGRGFSPILIAMGASAFAFSATRKAVVVEGMSDTLLLPSLIREATGSPYLEYQVAPSFADATRADVEDLDLVAARVAYLADGDEGGRGHARKLRDAGVLAEQIVFLGGEQSGLSPEDLLVRSVYVKAVNSALAIRHDVRIPATEIPETGRSAAVAAWCAQQLREDGRPIALSKVDIAQHVIDQSRESRLLAREHQDLLRDVDEQVRAILKRATAALGREEAETEEAAAQEGA